MTTRLYTAGEVANLFGMTRHWVLKHMCNDDAPDAAFEMHRGDVAQPLWTAAQVDHWRAYAAGQPSIPSHRKAAAYSDHNAVNQVGPVMVTWKLWWSNGADSTRWWFSTPRGWYRSDNNGVQWEDTGDLVRPQDYRYYAVNGTVVPMGTVATVLREAGKLRRRVEQMT